jgi:cysteinyl-tRNA synthetase
MVGGMGGEKMSKSLGNDTSLRNVLDTWGREVALMFFLGAHWRKPIEFGDEVLVQAKSQVDAFRNFFLDERPGDEDGEAILDDELAAVLDDDFNTPEALALFHAWRDREEWTSLRWGLGLFGLGALAEIEQAPAEVSELAEQRRAARDAKDFTESDRLRDEIAAAGWEVRDVADAPYFKLVRRYS